MAKTRITVLPLPAIATASDVNTSITDYLTRGQLIMNSVGGTLNLPMTGGGSPVALLPPASGSWVNLAWFPYTSTKQIFDRMDIIFNHQVSTGSADDIQLQYSLDSEASWTSANPGQAAFPLGIRLPFIIGGGTSLGPSMRTIDISGISGSQYIGFRYLVNATQEAFNWHAIAFLYLSSETPF